MNTDVQNGESKRKKISSCFHGLQLFAVQSVACVLVLIVVLLLRVVGGDVGEDVALRFNNAMLQNPLLSARADSSVPAEDEQTTAVANHSVEVICAPLVGGVLTSAYGEREDPFDSDKQDHHAGVDIAAGEGTPLAALKTGIVEEVGFEENGYGNYVIVACDATHRYLYAHCAAVQCKVGQAVDAGQTIALVGNTGKSTGSHVHIEWRENDKTVDPLTVLPEETYA